MAVHTTALELATRGNDQVIDLTDEVRRLVRESDLDEGIATVFVPGSTGAVTTVEYEPGLVEDLQAAVERLFPRKMRYGHNERQGDDNGHSHVRAAFLGPSLTVPFVNGSPTLGTWQQIVLVDLDSHPRRRRVIVQLQGE